MTAVMLGLSRNNYFPIIHKQFRKETLFPNENRSILLAGSMLTHSGH